MGKINCSVVQIFLARHCNLRCARCNTASPHLTPELAEFDSFKADVDALAKVMTVGELRFIGGEPLLNPDLMRFLKYADASPLSRTVALVTNGVLLHKAPPEMWPLLDAVAISRYPGVAFRVTAGEIDSLRKTHGVKFEFRDQQYFQQIMLNSLNKDAKLVQRIFNSCQITHVWKCHTVHNGWYYKCPVPMYVEERLAKVGVPLRSKHADGVKIHGNENLEADLTAYLSCRTPLTACSGCLGTSGKKWPSAQLSDSGLAAELAEDHNDIPALLDPGFVRG